jgi:hypothetical protein
LSSTVNAAVQPAFGHGAWPAWPQVPPMQPPAVHAPSPPEHIAPARTHVLVLWSQQPLLSPHTLSAQHGWPAPPHAWQELPPPAMRAHASPEAVQNCAPPPPVNAPQHAWLAPPQVMPPPPVGTQLPPVQVAIKPPHAPVGATQLPPTQHAPACAEQSLFSQHALPAVPHATTAPLAQTMPLAPGLSPVATQVPDGRQQPPPEQTLFGQHAWPGPPHAVQVPPPQVPPFWHVAPGAMH